MNWLQPLWGRLSRTFGRSAAAMAKTHIILECYPQTVCCFTIVTFEPQNYRSPVRSFVKRTTRTTLAQREAITTLLPSYAVNMAADFEKSVEFGRSAPCWLEIGFGNGQALLELAGRFPDVDFIGAEVHDPGVGRLLMGLQEQALTNVRVHHGDVVDLLKETIPDASLARILLWFTDPWPKKRHHKRRLLGPEMAALLSAKLESEGVLHTATDCEPYAGEGQYAPDADVRPETRFEERGRKLGHGVWDLQFSRSG